MVNRSASMMNTQSLDRLGRYGLVLARLIIGYLWFDQLDWKMPPTFGCPPGFPVSTGPDARTGGLCDWSGLVAVYSMVPAHAALYENFINPNLWWIGWGVWLLEAFTAASLILGLLTRFGAFLGILQGLNLFIGLAAAPFEWPWSYGQLITLELIFFCIPPGRTLGIDAWPRSRVFSRGKDSPLARIVEWLT
jgi:thiosulfate dehydrogenase [quinone] large subunit